ncbi:DsbC family protein [Pleionea sediminis]|uniref:DsbC family protein n=1 Tax=Pleionea sediminis TaxID=2569479 RepID=UPI001185CE8D|nr:DsbC family protein [Pleionea sediminis]
MKYNIISKSLFGLVTAGLIFGCSEATSDSTEAEAETEKKAVSDVKPVEKNSEAAEELTGADKVRKALEKQFGPIPIDKLRLSEMPGIYEVVAQGQVIYITEDTQFFFPGPLIALKDGNRVNLTDKTLREIELEKAPERAELMAAVDSNDTVLFKAENEKHVVNVFTDVDCAYCRRLHQQMDGYLKNGITIRYLAFPRAGIGSGSYNKLVSVWCSEDRKAAMDQAKLNNKFEPKECKNPVADQYTLVKKLGLSGTPALILTDGELISGFVEPDQLVEMLDSKAR